MVHVTYVAKLTLQNFTDQASEDKRNDDTDMELETGTTYINTRIRTAQSDWYACTEGVRAES